MIKQSLILLLVLFFISSCSLSSSTLSSNSTSLNRNLDVSRDDYVKIGPSTVRFDESLEQIPPIEVDVSQAFFNQDKFCLLYTSPSPRDGLLSRMPSSA